MNGLSYVVSLVLICFLYVGAYAGLNYTSRNDVVDDLVSSCDSGDLKRIQSRLNWAKIRYNLSKGADAQKDETVRYYVRPDSIFSLFFLKDQYFTDLSARNFIRDVSFHGPFRFSVLVGYPQTEESKGNPTMKEAMSQVRIFFHLEGWHWRAFKIDVPDFLIPQERLSAEEIKERFQTPDSL